MEHCLKYNNTPIEIYAPLFGEGIPEDYIGYRFTFGMIIRMRLRKKKGIYELHYR